MIKSVITNFSTFCATYYNRQEFYDYLKDKKILLTLHYLRSSRLITYRESDLRSNYNSAK